MVGKIVRWLIRNLGPVYLYTDPAGCSWYIGYCREHGYYIDYEHGWPPRSYIVCPDCRDSGDDDDDSGSGDDGDRPYGSFVSMVVQGDREIREQQERRRILGIGASMPFTVPSYRMLEGALGDDMREFIIAENRLYERTFCSRCPSGPTLCNTECFLDDSDFNDYSNVSS